MTKTYHVLSLGAGVQSTVLALLGVRGEIRYDAAIFADTGAEPKAVYRHLEWLIKECAPHFPVLVRAKGNIIDDLSRGENSTGQRFASAPFFTLHPDGSKGMTRRQCTKEYKTDVVERAIRRDILSLEPRKHVPKDVEIFQYLGMSADERKRIVRVRAVFTDSRYAKPVFPLLDLGMTRADCVRWLKNYGVPHETPRSACTFCPYHSDDEWLRIKNEDPESWEQAVQVDAKIREPGLILNRAFNSQRFVHRSCVPLDQVEFRPKVQDPQMKLPSMADECEGMCGT